MALVKPLQKHDKTIQPECNNHIENLRIAEVVEQIIEHPVSHKERKARVYERGQSFSMPVARATKRKSRPYKVILAI